MRRGILILGLLVASLGLPASAQAPPRHFLWTVSAPGAPPTYLLGSLHLLTPEYYPLGGRIEEAFAASQVLIQEIDLDEMSNPATILGVVGTAMLPPGQTLDQVIGPALHARVMARATRSGLPAEAVNRMKPWMAALSLTTPAMQAAGFKAEHGVDQHFFARAKRNNMSRRALETVAFQFERLDQMSTAEQEALLSSTIDDLDTQISNVKTIADAWARGRTTEIETLLLATVKQSPQLYKRLLVDRNASWVPAVARCLDERTSCFVVVGAAHLVGPDSLVAMLQRKGYAVEQQ